MSIVHTAPLDSKSDSQVKPPETVQGRLSRTRAVAVALRKITGLLCLGGLLAMGLAAVATLDYFVELPASLRVFWLIVLLGGTAVAARRAWKRWISPYSLARAAVDAERHEAQFGQRLRTTLDYDQREPSPAEASPALLDALRRDTSVVSRKVDWENLVDVRPMVAAFVGAALVVVVFGIGLFRSPDFRIATGRALLVPWDYTNVTFTPLAETVRIGASVEVKVEITGRPVKTAELRYREAGSDKWTVVDLAAHESDDRPRPEPIAGELTTTLADLRHDLEFEVIAGPRALPPGAIRVLQPLTLEHAQAHVAPPEYTRREPEDVAGLDLKVLEGSTVDLKIELNRPAGEAILRRIEQNGPGADTPVTIADRSLQVRLADLRQSATFMLSARAADGMTLDPQRISIRVQLDRKPEVKFIQPPEELVVTATTEIPMLIDVSDDIGLGKTGIQFQINDGPLQTLCEQDAAGENGPIQVSQLLLLEEHELTYKDSVTYFAFAEDNYFGSPRRTTTPLRFIDIRPFKREYQLVESQGGGESSSNGASVTLEELISRQRGILSQSFVAQQDQPVETALADRLHEAESDLVDATRELEQGLAERGLEIPTLTAAADDMDRAVHALAARTMDEAVAAEQQALANLIRARENVRQKLKQCNSQTASACQKFDREQRQKLRLPEKKRDDKQQKLADLRSQLEKLAQQERKWSQQAQQCCNNPSSSSQGSKSASNQQQNSQQESQQQQQQQAANDSKSEESPQQKSDDSNAPAPSPEEVARSQEEIRKQLAALREKFDKLAAAGKAAEEQLKSADEAMERGQQELARRDGNSAAREGERSAAALEQLSEHLAAMNSRDFGKRLETAQQLAQQLAEKQQSIDRQVNGSGSEKPSAEPRPSGSGSGKESRPSTDPKELAREEQTLAGRTDLLADQLAALARDASGERGAVKQKLAGTLAENPPRDAAAILREAAADLEAQRKAAAQRGVGQARERLDELAKSLGALRSEYAQPELEELVALERKLAELLEQARNGGKAGNRLEAAEQRWDDLEGRLQAMAGRDRRIADALRKVVGHGWIKLGDYSGATEVSKVLQMRIQEAIIAAALLDSDQPIPAEYKALVDQYYRALSDDLR